MSKKKPKKIPGIEILQSKTSLSYRASITVKGKLHRRTFKTQKEAIEWRDSQRSQRNKNKVQGIEEKNFIKFDVLFDYFIKSKAGKRETTIANYISVYNQHLKPYIGKKIIRDLKMIDYDNIKYKLIHKKCSDHLVNKVTTQLKSILAFAVQRGFLTVNFMQYQSLIKIDKQGYSYWKSDEIHEFLNKIKDDHYYWFYMFAFNTGLRRGELCGLKWSDINTKKETVTFGIQRLSSGKSIGLKGHQTRTVPLTKDAVLALKELQKRGNSSDYIFLNKKGNPINPDNISKQFRELQKKLKIEKQMKFHGIRHSFASFLASTNTPIQIIQKLLGHVDVKITQRYVHLTVDDLKNGIKDFKI